MDLDNADNYLASERQLFLDRCTACGRCVEACPMTPHLVQEKVPSSSVAAGLLELLRGRGNAAGEAFAGACCGTGRCRDVCPEGLSPYNLTRLAKIALQQSKVAADNEQPRRPRSQFKLMALSQALQIPNREARWFRGRPPVGVQAETVFYLGCNVLRTPHIALNAMEILDRMGVDFRAVGSGGNCCGSPQFREGDFRAADAVAANTFRNFAAFSPKEVVTWCPTCHLHFNDFGAAHLKPPFRIVHFTRFLVERLDRIKDFVLQPVPARVVIDEHSALDHEHSPVEDVKSILRLIPGIELVEIPQPAYGYHCFAVTNASAKAEVSEALLEGAAAAGVDYLVTLYHSCHRELVLSEQRYPFQVVNFTSLLARAMGAEHEDLYRRYKLMGNPERILEEVLSTVGDNGHPIEEIRRAIEWEFGRR